LDDRRDNSDFIFWISSRRGWFGYHANVFDRRISIFSRKDKSHYWFIFFNHIWTLKRVSNWCSSTNQDLWIKGTNLETRLGIEVDKKLGFTGLKTWPKISPSGIKCLPLAQNSSSSRLENIGRQCVFVWLVNLGILVSTSFTIIYTLIRKVDSAITFNVAYWRCIDDGSLNWKIDSKSRTRSRTRTKVGHAFFTTVPGRNVQNIVWIIQTLNVKYFSIVGSMLDEFHKS